MRTMMSLLAIVLSMASGCASYTLRGKVISSDFPSIEVVDADDPQLEEAGLGRATVRIYRDPDRLSRELVAQTTVPASGEIAIPIKAFGAGWMEEGWEIEVSRPGYHRVSNIMALPKSKRRLLVSMMPGKGAPMEDENLMEQFERFR